MLLQWVRHNVMGVRIGLPGGVEMLCGWSGDKGWMVGAGHKCGVVIMGGEVPVAHTG